MFVFLAGQPAVSDKFSSNEKKTKKLKAHKFFYSAIKTGILLFFLFSRIIERDIKLFPTEL